MDSLRITLCQQPLVWENRQKNRDDWENLLPMLKGKTDLVILPEMFTTGFTMSTAALAEPLQGQTFLWMRDMARELQATVTGSFICKEEREDCVHFFNRLLWMHTDGGFSHYDKRHLFTFAGEDAHFSAGQQRLTVELKGWRICPLICYDLRFPVWSRNTAREPYDLLLYVANWPEARSKAWKDLLVARAHENQCYVAGVNRVGTDGKGISYSGDSMAVSPKGDVLCALPEHKALLHTVELDAQELMDFRSKFKVLNDGDDFELR